MPGNIAEWLSETTARYDDIIGPLSSIFWLQGLEFLNELIDGPAYALEDEIVNPPQVFERLPRHLTKVALSGQDCDTTVCFWIGDPLSSPRKQSASNVADSSRYLRGANFCSCVKSGFTANSKTWYTSCWHYVRIFQSISLGHRNGHLGWIAWWFWRQIFFLSFLSGKSLTAIVFSSLYYVTVE